MERHKQAVTTIAAAVRGYFERSEPYRIFHGSTNSTRPRPKPGQPNVRFVDISPLSNVLSVDKTTRTALVEPNVAMDKLVEHTLPYGLVPPVVMEFPGITAGGGYAGTAGESSSFKHGFFDDTIESVEMVLGNGEIVKASRQERKDLFEGAAGAVGSLGITTLIELRLMEAKRYVQTTYHRVDSVAEALEKVQIETKDPANDYVDGIIYSRNHGVIITGRLTDEKPSDAVAQTFSGAWDPWYYMHVQERTANSRTARATPVTDYIPLAEYLFRYDRGGFWVGQSAFRYFWMVPFTRFFRWLLDDFLHTRMLYRALHGSGESARFVVQDLALPYSTAERFIDYTTEHFDIWPLWLCPLKQHPPPTFHPHTGEVDPETKQPKEILNIGLWGWGPKNPREFVRKNKELEDKLVELNGKKWFYAHSYYPEKQFWELYDKSWYDSLREKYHATSLPTVYDKVTVDVNARTKELENWRQSVKAIEPLGGMYGILKSIQSGDYFLHRNATWKHKEKKD
jgi:Delta24-sterol reductase